MPVGVTGVGVCTPTRRVTNEEIANWSGTTAEWIASRTGVQERRYVEVGTTTSDLAVGAANHALADARVDPHEIGLLIVATSTPDQPQPATAVHVQRKGLLPPCPAFDINAVCSGFPYALVAAASMLEVGGMGSNALCIGADVYSQIVDREDRRTVALFGDGAAAVVLGHVPDGYGLLGQSLIAHGTAADFVEVPAGGTNRPASSATVAGKDHKFQMQGRKVREYALTQVPRLATEALGRAGVTLRDIDRVVMHQGNVRLVEALAEKMHIDRSRVPVTGDLFGNTGAASVPLTLALSHEATPLRRGDLVLLAAVGGGMTAGAVVLRWY